MNRIIKGKGVVKCGKDIIFCDGLFPDEEADVRNIGSNRVIEKCGFTFTHKEDLEHCSQFKPEPTTANWYKLSK